jgi:hypothetical protein
VLVQPQVDPTLGRVFVLGWAPPRGQARRWAAGQGPHRFVQDFRGVDVDISGLRLAAIDARGMRRVFPRPFQMGMLPMLFGNEYPDDDCDPPPPSSSDTPSTCNGGEPDGGPGDTKLWVVARFQPDPTPVPVCDGGGDEESEAGSDVEPGEGSYEEGDESDCESVTPHAAEWAESPGDNYAAVSHVGVGATSAPESVRRTTTNKKMLEVRAPRVALWVKINVPAVVSSLPSPPAVWLSHFFCSGRRCRLCGPVLAVLRSACAAVQRTGKRGCTATLNPECVPRRTRHRELVATADGTRVGREIRPQAAKNLATHPLMAMSSSLVTIVHGDRPSFVLRHRAGTFLLDTYEPRVGQLVDGYLTLIINVPDSGLIHHKSQSEPLLKEAMSTLLKLVEVRTAIHLEPAPLRVVELSRSRLPRPRLRTLGALKPVWYLPTHARFSGERGFDRRMCHPIATCLRHHLRVRCSTRCCTTSPPTPLTSR